jgi:hypothetical protein
VVIYSVLGGNGYPIRLSRIIVFIISAENVSAAKAINIWIIMNRSIGAVANRPLVKRKVIWIIKV